MKAAYIVVTQYFIHAILRWMTWGDKPFSFSLQIMNKIRVNPFKTNYNCTDLKIVFGFFLIN